MNIEIDRDTLVELETAFKFNDAVLRHLTVKKDGAEVGPSPMMTGEKAKNLNMSEGADAPAAAA